MLVLKIIGIVLLSILALILLLLLLILFVPIRYDATAFADGTDLEKLKAKGRVYWLFHLISFGATFQEKQFKLSGRIAFYKLFEEKKEKEESHKNKKKEKKKSQKDSDEVFFEKLSEDNMQSEEEHNSNQPVEEKQPEPEKTEAVSEEKDGQEATEPEKSQEAKVEEKTETRAKPKKEKKKKHKKEKKKKEKRDKKPKDPNSLPNRLKRLFEKREKVLRVYEKEKKNLQVALRRTGRILKKILPRKCMGYVEFGMSDPASTGKILGYVSALYAMTGPLLNLYPDFTEEKLKADVKLKGHFTLFSVGLYILQVPLNKELKRAYRYLKKLSLEEPEKKADSDSSKEETQNKSEDN